MVMSNTQLARGWVIQPTYGVILQPMCFLAHQITYCICSHEIERNSEQVCSVIAEQLPGSALPRHLLICLLQYVLPCPCSVAKPVGNMKHS